MLGVNVGLLRAELELGFRDGLGLGYGVRATEVGDGDLRVGQVSARGQLCYYFSSESECTAT